MKQHLEIEYKSRIDYNSYIKIKNYFPFSEPVFQENIYYDTAASDLMKQRIMCRVRKLKDASLFTLKEPQPHGVMEYEFKINESILIDSRTQDVLNRFNVRVSDLVEVGFSNTVRYEYKDAYGTWCLDVTQFKHHKDYELEYELFEENALAQNHYLSTMKAMDVTPRKIEPKFIRALHSSVELMTEDDFPKFDVQPK